MVLKRLGLVVVGLVLGVLAAELGVRVAAPIPAEELLFGAPDRTPSGLYTPDGRLFMLPTPGFVGEVGSARIPLRVNRYGLRGGEPGVGPHWLAVGDSFTMATQVVEEDHFAALLGNALSVEVLNGGVDGFSTWQATARYRQIADQLPVDTVLLTLFLGNDLTDNDRWPGIAQNLDPRHPPVIPPRAPQSRWIAFLNDHVRLYGWYRVGQRRGAIAPQEQKRFADELRIFTTGGRGALDVCIRKTNDALVELRDEAARRGDRLMVAVAPPSFATDPARAEATLSTFGLSGPAIDAPHAATIALLTRLGIETCDLAPSVADSDSYLRFDGHWSVKGHRRVAEALALCARD